MISDDPTEDDTDDTDSAEVPESTLKTILSYLPYPIRELPGFRSGKLLFLCAAIFWYAILIAVGFFAVVKDPQYTPEQNKLYDIATFALFFLPTLYLGNYLGTRDKLPWKRSKSLWVEIIRIVLGVILIAMIVIAAASIVAAIFDI